MRFQAEVEDLDWTGKVMSMREHRVCGIPAAAVAAAVILCAPNCSAATQREIYASYRKELRAAWRMRDYLLPPWLDRSLNTVALTGFYLAGALSGINFIEPQMPPPDVEAERRLAPEPPVKLPDLAERVPLTNYTCCVTDSATGKSLGMNDLDGGHLILADQGNVRENPALRLYPTGKRGAILATMDMQPVFFYDYGRVAHLCDFPVWRKPKIRRGNAILKCGRLYRVHCEAEKIDCLIYIEDMEKH